jgi:hypothetical protein
VEEKALILPHGRHTNPSGTNGAYIQQWARRLLPVIQAANLTVEQRNNIGRVIDREMKLVFVEGRAKPEERIKYWESRCMSPETREFMNNLAIGREMRRIEAVQEFRKLVARAVPEGYEPNSNERLMLGTIESKLQGIEEIWSVMGTVQEIGREMVKNLRIQIEEKAAQEEARQRSIELARQKPQFPGSK